MEGPAPATMRKEAMESITDRLSGVDDLYFPRALLPSAATPSLRKSLLLDLLSCDAPVFLERYGAQLTAEELGEFDVLGGDYEVSWHLKNIRRKLSPSSEDLRTRAVRVKNRRRAYMNKLIGEGKYFSEEAMREREPYLHHEYVGKFQDLTGRCMARPGEKWSETLMRRWEEAGLLQKIREEQIRLGVDESQWVGNERKEEGDDEQMEEEEEEEEEEDEKEEEQEEEEGEGEGNKEEVSKLNVNGDKHSSEISDENMTERPGNLQPNAEASISAEDLEDGMDQFTYIMQQKFLAGEDHQHLDYSKIDDDETLDDHWLREANRDAEDKYFAEDGDDDDSLD